MFFVLRPLDDAVALREGEIVETLGLRDDSDGGIEVVGCFRC